MTSRKKAGAAVVILLSLPLLLALSQAASFSFHNRNNGSFISSGETRGYLLFVPSSYDGSHPAPLVISLHGAGGWPTQQMEMSNWNRLAESQRFLVVYPSGVDSPGARVWRVSPGAGLVRDVRFISDLIDRLGASYNIDRSRIYANGFSNGGGMSFALSCTLSDRIAAVGLVAAARTLPFRWCTDRRAVPMIAFQGTADPMIPYNGGATWIAPKPFPNVPAFTASWARRNGCGTTPVESTVAADVSRREYTHCADDAAVVLYTIRGGGHSWPGGGPLPEWFVGPTSRSIDATARMWAFFLEHPLRGAAPVSERAAQPAWPRRSPVRTDQADGRNVPSLRPFAARSR